MRLKWVYTAHASLFISVFEFEFIHRCFACSWVDSVTGNVIATDCGGPINCQVAIVSPLFRLHA